MLKIWLPLVNVTGSNEFIGQTITWRENVNIEFDLLRVFELSDCLSIAVEELVDKGLNEGKI